MQKAVQSQVDKSGPGSYFAAAPTPPATASKDWYQVGSDLKMLRIGAVGYLAVYLFGSLHINNVLHLGR